MKRRPRQRDTLLLVESNRRMRDRLARELRSSGHPTRAVASREAAEKMLADEVPSLVLCGGAVPTADDFLRQVKASGRNAPACVLLVRSDTPENASRATAAGADNYLVYPFKGADVLASMRWLEQIRSLRAQLERPEPTPAPEPVPGSADPRGIFDPSTGFYTFASFKQILFIEVKRALRYGFPLSVAMIAYDPIDVPPAVEVEVQAMLRGGLGVAIRKSLRDTDLPVYYKGEHVLVVMPHTDRKGALVVAQRIQARVDRSTLRVAGVVLKPSISTGLGWAQDLKTESFADIIKVASRHLAEARKAGGGQVRPEA
jgi:PleD family two-component response regulator